MAVPGLEVPLPLTGHSFIQTPLLAGRPAPGSGGGLLALRPDAAVPAAPLALPVPGPVLEGHHGLPAPGLLLGRVTVPMTGPGQPGRLPFAQGHGAPLVVQGTRQVPSVPLEGPPAADALLLTLLQTQAQGRPLDGPGSPVEAGVGIEWVEGAQGVEGVEGVHGWGLLLVEGLLAGHLHVPSQLAGALLPHRHVVSAPSLPPGKGERARAWSELTAKGQGGRPRGRGQPSVAVGWGDTQCRERTGEPRTCRQGAQKDARGRGGGGTTVPRSVGLPALITAPQELRGVGSAQA